MRYRAGLHWEAQRVLFDVDVASIRTKVEPDGAADGRSQMPVAESAAVYRRAQSDLHRRVWLDALFCGQGQTGLAVTRGNEFNLNCPAITPLREDRFRVSGPDDTMPGEGNAMHAVSLVVQHPPPGCRPAVHGTADVSRRRPPTRVTVKGTGPDTLRSVSNREADARQFPSPHEFTSLLPPCSGSRARWLSASGPSNPPGDAGGRGSPGMTPASSRPVRHRPRTAGGPRR